MQKCVLGHRPSPAVETPSSSSNPCWLCPVSPAPSSLPWASLEPLAIFAFTASYPVSLTPACPVPWARRRRPRTSSASKAPHTAASLYRPDRPHPPSCAGAASRPPTSPVPSATLWCPSGTAERCVDLQPRRAPRSGLDAAGSGITTFPLWVPEWEPWPVRRPSGQRGGLQAGNCARFSRRHFPLGPERISSPRVRSRLVDKKGF